MEPFAFSQERRDPRQRTLLDMTVVLATGNNGERAAAPFE
jgi:hypothetical protein